MLASRIHNLCAHLVAIVLTASWMRVGLARCLHHVSSALSGGSAFVLTGTGDPGRSGADMWRFPWAMVAFVTGVTAVVVIGLNVAVRRGAIRPVWPLVLSCAAVVLASVPFAMSRFDVADDLTTWMMATALVGWILVPSFVVYWGTVRAITRLSARQ